jgi:drug/metabolite transporter (DMT)-like permease
LRRTAWAGGHVRLRAVGAMTRPGGLGLGVVAVLGSVLLWGAQFPVAKAAYAALDPYTLTSARYLLAATVLLLLVAATGGGAAFSPGPRPGRLVLAGVLGMAGSPLLVFVGLAYTLPEHAVIIVALQPSITAMVQWRLHGKRPAPFTLGAIIVAFTGVVLVVASHGFRPGEAKLFGDLMVLAGCCCWISYTLMLAGFPGLGALRFTAFTCFFGALTICAVTSVALLSGAVRMPPASAFVNVMPHIVFLAIPGVVLAMFLWNYGNARIGPLNSMLLLNLMPIETYSIRYLQGARFTWQEWAGAALVVCALVANNIYQRRRVVT